MPDTLCRVAVRREGEIPVVSLSGEVDISNVDHVEHELGLASEARDRVCVVDLTEAQYFDSAGIRLLFSLARRLKARRQELHVIVPRHSVIHRVLEITDLGRLVPVHAGMEAFLQRGS